MARILPANAPLCTSSDPRATPVPMGRQKHRPPMDVPDFAAQAETAYFEERAAIREFLGNQDRDTAEWGAAEDTQRWKQQEALAALNAEPSWRERTR